MYIGLQRHITGIDENKFVAIKLNWRIYSKTLMTNEKP